MKYFNALLIVLIILIPVHGVYVLRNSAFFKPTYVTTHLKEKSIDYVVLGSSRGLTTLDTKVLDSVWGTNGFNASLDGQNILGGVMMLEHLLANNTKFRACILSLDIGDVGKGFDQPSSNSYRWISYINSGYISKYFKEFNDTPSKLISTSRIWPGFGFWYNNKKLVPAYLFSLYNNKARNKYDSLGNFSYPVRSNASKTLKKKEGKIHLELKGLAFEKIKTICEENNIQLIVYVAPYYGKKITFSESDILVNHSALFLDADSLFYDDIHVNSQGRYLASLKLADSLKELVLSYQNVELDNEWTEYETYRKRHIQLNKPDPLICPKCQLIMTKMDKITIAKHLIDDP